MKEKLKAIFKFILFILFAKSMYFWTFYSPEIKFFEIITNDGLSICMLIFIGFIICPIFKSILIYPVAKRFGVIQFLNRFNFFIDLFFVCIIECIILYYYGDTFQNKIIQENFKDIFLFSILGYGFLYTFLIYKIAKIYDKKYPAFFGKIKEFKNIITNKIPFLKHDLFWLLIYGFLLLQIYDNETNCIRYWVFFYSGVLFFVITIILTIYNMFKNNIQKHKL